MPTRRTVLASLAATGLALRSARAAAISPFSQSNRIGKGGWLRDQIVDATVPTYSAPLSKNAGDIDLRPAFPPAFAQGALESCVANAVASLVQYVRAQAGQKPAFVPSRMFFYYYGRFLSQSRDPSKASVNRDDGMSYVDALTTIRSFGICPEELWRYQPDKVATEPSDAAYVAARRHRALGDETTLLKLDFATLIDSLQQARPFLLGFDVYRSFADAPGAIIPIPTQQERADKATYRLFGHGVLVVGYLSKEKLFICRNSWGPHVQDRGYFYLPVDYVLDDDLVGSIWTIGRVLAAM